MGPLQIDTADRSEPVALQFDPPCRRADCGSKGAIERTERLDAPAGEYGARLSVRRGSQQPAHHPIVACLQRQAAAGNEVEIAGIAPDLAKRGGKAAAGKALFKSPQRIAGIADGHEDQPGRIKTESSKARAVEETCLMIAVAGRNPEDWPSVDRGKAGKHCEDETRRCTTGIGHPGADLMEPATWQAAPELAVERIDPQCQPLVGGRQGAEAAIRHRQGVGSAGFGDMIRPSLNPGDAMAKCRELFVCHAGTLPKASVVFPFCSSYRPRRVKPAGLGRRFDGINHCLIE